MRTFELIGNTTTEDYRPTYPNEQLKF